MNGNMRNAEMARKASIQRVVACHLVVFLLCVQLATATPYVPPPSQPATLTIRTEDVDRFFAVYDQAGGHPTAAQLQHDYLDPGTDGFHEFAKVRRISGVAIADTLAQHPEIYSGAKRCMVVLPQVRQRLLVALTKLGELYPDAKFPPVTIAVGRGKPVGTANHAAGVMIGLEALCATDWLNPNVEDRFVYVISHEYIHVQQTYDPEHPTVLGAALAEGGAEFVGELISGGVAYSEFATSLKGREKEVEIEFLADKDSTDLSKWFHNSSLQKSGDLGYWVGYRIAKAYYQGATDKRSALRDIILMSDPNAFLAMSGWHPGMQLQ